MMHESLARTLKFSRESLVNLAAALAMAAPVVFGLMDTDQLRAQAPAPTAAPSPAPNSAQDLSGTWQGTLHAGQDLRLVLKITKTEGGVYNAVAYSIDQGGAPIPVTKITLDGGAVKMSVTAIGGTYEGKMSADGKSIVGSWSQGPNPLPLTYTRATPETEWTIPPPPVQLPPMAADANPSFEVATIKPSKPDDQRKAFIVRGNEFHIINQPLTQMISFAFDVQAKQVIGLPDWAESDKFDIDGKPDGEGAPNGKQWKIMIQKLLVDRFGLKFHKDKKELSVYVLSVSKTGQKMTKNDSSPNGLPGLFFQGLGKLNVRNAL